MIRDNSDISKELLHRARELLQEKRVDCSLCPGYWGLHEATEGFPCLGAMLENELLRALEKPLEIALDEKEEREKWENWEIPR